MDEAERERELIRHAAAGDEEAFRVLVDASWRAVYDLAYRVTADRETAEDVVQETFLRAYRALPAFHGAARFSTWVHRIARNAAIDALRRARARRGVDVVMEPGAEPAHCHAPDPERLAASGDLGRALARALAGLSDLERAAFVLRHHEGCSTAEIGAELGLKSSTTRQTIFRAVRKLRTALAPFAGHRVAECVGERARERVCGTGAS